jgi:DNA polymerase-1
MYKCQYIFYFILGVYAIITIAGENMKKIILIDGNNLLFRSYYATAYTGNMMKNSKGFPTNALYGFINMLNKIINEEKPTYMAVAFDIGKSFRHEAFANYKVGRIEMPDELREQFPIAKEILNAMGIKYLEVDNYEADDIIGTLAKMIDIDQSFIGTIVSSDKDLLQLISHDINVKLLKQKDHILYDEKTFKQDFGIDPIRVIDLKALQGDSSDKIPGVKGIGEKTALTLIQQYDNIDNLYQNIDKITGKLKDKLIADKDNAYMSKELATIYKDVPININLEDLKYEGINVSNVIKLYEELEFYSLLKNIRQEKVIDNDEQVKIINNLDNLVIDDEAALYLEILDSNYHIGQILGIGIYNRNHSYFIPYDVLKQKPNYHFHNIAYTYDLKKVIVSLQWQDIKIDDVQFDLMIAAHLLNYNIKPDISYLANQLGYDIPFYETSYKNKEIDEQMIANLCVKKAKFIYEVYERFNDELKKEKVEELFNEIEMPLIKVLADMEYTGVNVNLDTLNDIGNTLKVRIDDLTNEIYDLAGTIFNIGSPKQLGDILFAKLNLPYGKKGKTGYSTDRNVLHKLKGIHPIIDKILDYRTLTKIYNTYVEGLKNYILTDNKIHTIYTQTLTRTGRLSSIEPNLQNIPIRNEEGRIIRKAFEPSKGYLLMSSDYSQIELRVLAHFSKASNLVEAFNKGMDIHTKTAMDIFHVPEDKVTSDMRRQAKAVNFGIIYGISSFGLSENLDIDVKAAKLFIDKYLETFPGIKQYMDKVIKEAHEKGYVTTITNRKRVIDELKNPNYMIRSQGERMALNTPIQGSSADIIKKAMVEIYRAFSDQKLASRMILQVHDELVFEVKEEEKDIVMKLVEDIMENVYKLDVPLKVDISFGKDWYDTK